MMDIRNVVRQSKRELRHLPTITDQQALFCQSLGLSVAGEVMSLVLAKIDDLIDVGFYGTTDLGCPTDKQVKFAAKFGYDISDKTRREGTAIVSAIFIELNLESIEQQGLCPGVTVINDWDQLHRSAVISSIRDDGLVFYKGGNGKRAWARNLRKINDN